MPIFHGKLHLLSCALVCLLGITAAPVNAEQKSIYFAQARASIYGVGLGIAGVVDVQGTPTQVEKVNSPSSPNQSLELRTYILPGIKVVNIKSHNIEGFLPLTVEISNPGALLKISRQFSELNHAAVLANLGPPDEKHGNSFIYQGLSESCSDTVQFHFQNDKLAEIKWHFCTE